MAKEKIAILMDSGGDLPYELCQKEGIEFLPLHVIYPEKDYLDGVDIDPMVIYRRFPDEIPSTSTPSIQEVLDCFENLHERGFTHVIAVTISSGLSSTGNTIAMAAKQYDKLKVHVFDSKNISFGSGIFALWAARKNREGVPFDELVQMLENKRHDSRIFFYMDTLKYLRHGGRIGKVSSIVGDALHIKPIISCNEEGVYYTVAKIRGQKVGKRRLLEEVLKTAGNAKCWIIVGEGNAHEEAVRMEQLVMSKLANATHLLTKQITATLANNTGPGLIGVEVFLNP